MYMCIHIYISSLFTLTYYETCLLGIYIYIRAYVCVCASGFLVVCFKGNYF